MAVITVEVTDEATMPPRKLIKDLQTAETFLAEYNHTGVNIHPDEIIGLLGGPDTLGTVQKRLAIIYDHRVAGRLKVIEGEYWGTGYDERVSEELNSMNLPDGQYVATFVPRGEEQGMYTVVALTVVPA